MSTPRRRWTCVRRRGMTHAEAGARGGRAGLPPFSPATREEVVTRWKIGDGSQRALAREIGLSPSTVSGWCRAAATDDPPGKEAQDGT